MTRRTAVLAFEAGQLAIALCAFVLVDEAPDRIVAVFYLGMLALVSLALSAIYTALGTLHRTTNPSVVMHIAGNATGGATGAVEIVHDPADLADTLRPIINRDLLDDSDRRPR